MLQFSIRRPPARLGMVASAIAADEECATALSHNTPAQQDWTAAECTSVDGVRLTSRLFQEASLMPLAVLSLTRHVRDECPPKCATEVKLYAIDRVQYDATYDSSSLENELNDSFLMNLDGVACPEHHVIMMDGIAQRRQVLTSCCEIYIKTRTAKQGGRHGTKSQTESTTTDWAYLPMSAGMTGKSSLQQAHRCELRMSRATRPVLRREFTRAGNNSSIHHRHLPGICLPPGRGNIMIAMTISSWSLTTTYSQVPRTAESLGLFFPGCCTAHLRGIVQR